MSLRIIKQEQHRVIFTIRNNGSLCAVKMLNVGGRGHSTFFSMFCLFLPVNT